LLAGINNQKDDYVEKKQLFVLFFQISVDISPKNDYYDDIVI